MGQGHLGRSGTVRGIIGEVRDWFGRFKTGVEGP